jgi:trigger factor
VLELADRHDLGSCAARREGSSPSFPTAIIFYKGCPLKFTKEILDDQQARITVEFEASVMDEFNQKAVRKISSKTKIAGFRPGKAPVEVVKRLYGEEAIEEEAIELLVNDIYPKLLKEAEVTPAAPGRLEKTESKNPPKFVFLIPLEPVVKLGEYQTIRMDYSPAPVKDEEIDQVIHRLQLNNSTAEPVDREARNGDLVELKLNALLINPKDGENAEVIKDSPYQLIIGEEDQKEEQFPFEGFESFIIGLKKDEEKKFNYTYPKISTYEKLQDKDVEFSVIIQNIRELKKPELNDDFAKNLGNYETFTSLRDSIKKELGEAKIHDYDHKFYDDLVDKIISISKVKYPPQVLDDEVQRVLNNFEQNLASQNLDLPTYLMINQLEKEKFIENEIKPAAKHQLEQYLVLEEIRKQEKVELEKEELQKAYSESLLELQSNSDIKKLRKQITSKELANRVLLQAASRLINKRVELRLKDIVTGKTIQEPKKTEKSSKKISQTKKKKQE